MKTQIILSIIDAFVITLILTVFTYISKKITLTSFLSESKEKGNYTKKKKESSESQMKWFLVSFPIIIVIIYGIYLLDFPVVFFFFAVFYLGYVITIPSLFFSLDLAKKYQILSSLCFMALPVFYFFTNFYGMSLILNRILFNLLTISFCFTVLVTSFKEIDLNDKFVLLFFVILFIYDIIAVGSGLLVEVVKAVGRQAQKTGFWLFPPIILILPGSPSFLWFGLGDLFLLGIAFIKIEHNKHLFLLISLLFPILAVTFFVVQTMKIPLPASFLGFISFLALKYLEKNKEEENNF